MDWATGQRIKSEEGDGVTTRNIPVGATTLAVDESGSGTAILLLHAGIATRRMWDPQWSGSFQSFRTVRFDMRGFGDSPMVPGKFSPTEDAVAVLDELKIESAILVGCSYGGATAIHLALTHPERVNGLVLIGSGVHGYDDSETLPSVFVEMEDAWNNERVLDLEEQAFIVGLGRHRDELDSRFLSVCREMNQTKFRWEEVQAENLDDVSHDAEYLSSITVPTLAMVGDEDIPLVQRQAKFIAEQIPRASLKVIPNCAHLPNLENPQLFDSIVSPWILGL